MSSSAPSDEDSEFGPGPMAIGPRPATGHVPHVPQPPFEMVYFLLGSLFVALLVLTNVVGTKLFALPLDIPVAGVVLRAVDRFNLWAFGVGGGDSLALTAGIVTYPLTFLITDIVSETWGRRRADVMVLLGFGGSLLMLLVISVAGQLVPAEVWKMPAQYAHVLADPYLVRAGGVTEGSHLAAQAAYRFTFDAPGTLLMASMTAYLVAQLVDNRLFHFWRRVTKGKALWFRNNASTGISQLVDTMIVNGIFLHFYWKLPLPTIAAVIASAYAVKLMIALADTPFCYLGVWWVGRTIRASHPDPTPDGDTP